MTEDSELLCLCPLKGVIDTIGKKWSLLVINAIANHRRIRFNELMHELKGVSPRTLNETLKDLQSTGLVKREAFQEIPPRVEYYLSEDGAELRKAMVPLLQWALRRTDPEFTSCCGNLPLVIRKG
jgi:DNA-binding HxlR family transcriptional regulator